MAAGDTVALYVWQSTVKLLINGTVVETVTDSSVAYVSSGANAGLRVGTSGTVSIDNYALDTVA